MALMEGPQKAVVLKNYLEKDVKGQVFVNLKLGFQGEEAVLYTRIYITAKAAGIARAKLRKVNFDLDTQQLNEIKANDSLLSGHEVDVMLTKNGQYMNVDIPTVRPQVEKEAVDAAQEMLNNAKKSEASQEEEADIPF